MKYEKPNLNEMDPIRINQYLFRLVDQIEEHEEILRKDIEAMMKGNNNGKSEQSTARGN